LEGRNQKKSKKKKKTKSFFWSFRQTLGGPSLRRGAWVEGLMRGHIFSVCRGGQIKLGGKEKKKAPGLQRVKKTKSRQDRTGTVGR